MTNTVNRKDWIDIAKGIGIILVVIGHTRFSTGIVGEWINSFHMPLFFILAGFCFNEHRYPNLLYYFLRKINVLVFPYVTLSLFAISILNLFYFGSDPQFSTIVLLRKIPTGILGAFWFIPVLVQVEILFAVLMRYIDSLQARILLCGIILCIANSLKGCNLPYAFDMVLLSIPFYGLGYFVKGIEETYIFKKKRFLIIGFCTFILFNVIVLLYIPLNVSYVCKQYANVGLFLLCAFAGTGAITFLSRFIELQGFNLFHIKDILTFLGRQSIVLLATHTTFGLCRSTWELGWIGYVLEAGGLVLCLYLFSGPFKCLILNRRMS